MYNLHYIFYCICSILYLKSLHTLIIDPYFLAYDLSNYYIAMYTML